MAAADAKEQAVGSKTTPQDLVLKVAGAIGTGLGILGFVAFFGGAVLWLRADQAGLPANDAVSVIPNSVLVTTGASFLVPAVLIALLAVTLLFTVYLVPNIFRQGSARQSGKEVTKLQGELEALRGESEEAAAIALTVRKAAAEAGPETAGNALQTATDRTNEESAAAGRLKAKEREIKEQEEIARGKLTQKTWQFWLELGLGFAAVLLLPPLLNKAIFSVPFFWSGVILVLVALGAAGMSALVYMSTRKRVWFGVAAFLTIGIYIGFATYYSTTRNLKVEPAAALRGERAPVVGSFIADTSESLYLGTFPEGTRKPRLIVIPRAQVTSLSIGPLTDPEDASASSIKLALDECRQKVDVPKTKEEAAHVERACTSGQRSILESRLTP